jgi:hypothetical protein
VRFEWQPHYLLRWRLGDVDRLEQQLERVLVQLRLQRQLKQERTAAAAQVVAKLPPPPPNTMIFDPRGLAALGLSRGETDALLTLMRRGECSWLNTSGASQTAG